MSGNESRSNSKSTVVARNSRKIELPKMANGAFQKVSDYYGENVFDYKKIGARIFGLKHGPCALTADCDLRHDAHEERSAYTRTERTDAS